MAPIIVRTKHNQTRTMAEDPGELSRVNLSAMLKEWLKFIIEKRDCQRPIFNNG